MEHEKIFWLKPSTIDEIMDILKAQKCMIKKSYIEKSREGHAVECMYLRDDIIKLDNYLIELELARAEQIAKSKDENK